MTSCLSKLKVTPTFCFAFKVPDNVAASSKYSGNALARVQRVHEPVDLWDITFCNPLILRLLHSTMCTCCFDHKNAGDFIVLTDINASISVTSILHFSIFSKRRIFFCFYFHRCSHGSSKSPSIWLSKSFFYVKNHSNLYFIFWRFILRHSHIFKEDPTQCNRDHPYITSAHFWTILGPTHPPYVSTNT